MKSINYAPMRSLISATKKTAAIFAILIVSVMFITSCTDKDSTPNRKADNYKRPIASRNAASSDIAFHVKLEKLQSALEQGPMRGNNYVIESVQIIDEPATDLPLTLKIVILDTENEVSITKFLIQDFIEKEIVSDSVYYYLGDEIIAGTYTFLTTDENGKNYNVHVSNGSLLSKEVLVGDIPPGPGFREIVCVSRNCISSCDLILAGYMYDCTPCNPDPEAGNNYTCYKSDMSYCLTPAIADLMR